MRGAWAEEKARFTALVAALAIDWMKQAAIATVAERLRLSWDEAAHIQAQRMGKCRTSEEYLKTAVEMFAGMGMGFWRAQAEASLTGPGGVQAAKRVDSRASF